MSGLCWLADERLARTEPFFPKPRGRPRADDKKAAGGTAFMIRDGSRWRDAPKEHGPRETPCNRWKRWSKKGIFAGMFPELAGEGGKAGTPAVDATRPEARRAASGPGPEERDGGRKIGRTKGGTDSEPRADDDDRGRPLRMVPAAGQRGGYIGARELAEDLPEAKHTVADRGHGAGWFRKDPENKKTGPRIPPRKRQNAAVPHGAKRQKERRRAGNFFGRPEDWRRVAARHDRCPGVFFSACALAAVVLYWL